MPTADNSSEMEASKMELAVQQCQQLLAHAWMVRTFVKHSPEAEDFPELMILPRTVFDVSRSLESRKDDPPAYFRQLKKKLHRLKAAAAEFAEHAPMASTHLNFQQAVISFNACVEGLEQVALACARGKGISIDETLNTARQNPDDTA